MHRVDEVIRLLAVDTVEVRVKMPGGLPVTRKDGTVEPR
jgi:hypothetical protein